MATAKERTKCPMDTTTDPNSADRLAPQRPPVEGDRPVVSTQGENTGTRRHPGKSNYSEKQIHTLSHSHTQSNNTAPQHTQQTSASSLHDTILLLEVETNTALSLPDLPTSSRLETTALSNRDTRTINRNSNKRPASTSTPVRNQKHSRALNGRFHKANTSTATRPLDVGANVCYVCNKTSIPKLLNKLMDQTSMIQNAAIMHRANLQHPVQAITGESKICNHCLKHTNNYCYEEGIVFRQVLTGSFRRCIVCTSLNNLTLVPFSARKKAYIEHDLFIKNRARICKEHLTPTKHIITPLCNGLRYKNLRVFMTQDEMSKWMECLRNEIKTQKIKAYTTEEDFTDANFEIFTGISKANFLDLYSYCGDTVRVNKKNYKCTKKHLLMFLAKMRQGISDMFLKAIFKVSTRQAVSLGIKIATQHLKEKFLPLNLGVSEEHITRNNLITTHVTDFANALYNSDNNFMPRPKVLILYVDGTYLYVPKGKIHRVLRQTFCYHKGRHLIKPIMIVLPDGYILDVHGPYFSDSVNNDAACLIAELNKQVNGLQDILEPNDIFVVDRGYRDALHLLTSLGLNHNMPQLLPKGNKQLTCEEANLSRLVTKTRWIVETRNGHVKSIFKLFQEMIPAQLVPIIGVMFKIGCAIINKYFKPIHMEGADQELAAEMLQKVKEINTVQCIVEQEKLKSRQHVYFEMGKEHLPGFPKLSEEYLRTLMFGSYQLRLSKSYIQDVEDRDSEFLYDILLEYDGLLRAKLYSKHSYKTKYTVWIAYNDALLDAESKESEDQNPIQGYYCSCKSGARTLGSCTHVATVLWYMGYARHEEQFIKYPSYKTLIAIEDAANRTLPAKAAQEVDIPEIIDPQDYLEVQLVEG